MRKSIGLTAVALLATGLTSFLAPSTARAATAYALTDNNFLLKFDTASPTVLSGVGPILNASNNAVQDLIGIDFRTVNGQLYAVGAGLALYTIDPNTAVATQVGTLSASGTDLSNPFTGFSGSRFGFDFEPVSDGANFFALRITSNAGQNVRVNIADGAVITDAPFAAGLTGVAHNPPTPGPLGAYAIDPVSDQLVLITGAGTFTNVGPLGIDVAALGGFDTVTNGSTNFAYAALQEASLGVSRFYTINLATGAATLVGTIDGGELMDGLAVVIPEPTSLALVGAGALSLLSRRRRSC